MWSILEKGFGAAENNEYSSAVGLNILLMTYCVVKLWSFLCSFLSAGFIHQPEQVIKISHYHYTQIYLSLYVQVCLFYEVEYTDVWLEVCLVR
jgi:hypothetical protein